MVSSNIEVVLRTLWLRRKSRYQQGLLEVKTKIGGNQIFNQESFEKAAKSITMYDHFP